MRTLAITGIDTVSMISRITRGAAIRATPPSLRMSEGTRSSAIPEQAPASSAISACSALVTSIITPPLSISASPTFTRHKLLFIKSMISPFGFRSAQQENRYLTQKSPTFDRAGCAYLHKPPFSLREHHALGVANFALAHAAPSLPPHFPTLYNH